MNSPIAIAIVAGSLAMIGWGCADFFAKKTIDQIGDIATLFWGQLLGLIPLVFLYFFWHQSPPSLAPIDTLLFLVFGVVSALSYLLLYRGFERGKVSILSPIFASYAGTVVLISAFVFGEEIPPLRWLAIAVIFFGIITMSTDISDFKKSLRARGRMGGVPEVLIAMVVFSFWLAFWGRYVSVDHWVFYVLAMRAIAVATLLVFAGLKHLTLWPKQTSKLIWPLMLIGFFDVMAYAAVTWGFGATPLISVVALLSGAFSLPTLVLARVFLKEKLNRMQALSVAAIIVGIVMVAL
jgi:drug/metabolite transporter (DMT)-like permease